MNKGLICHVVKMALYYISSLLYCESPDTFLVIHYDRRLTFPASLGLLIATIVLLSLENHILRMLPDRRLFL